jgi:2-polyprenyl-3-methyl-5-hydroxy-6-metoxy-1,4-benzoquinol methylase
LAERNVLAFFDSYATDFAAIYGTGNDLSARIVNRFFRQSMRLRYLHTLAGCEPISGCDVLDIGCGPGHYTVALAQMGARSALGIDFAEGMLDLARERAAVQGVSDTCRFETMDFRDMPQDQAFDYVVVMGFMDYIADPRGVIEKVVAMTRKKAFFSFPLDGGFLAWQRKLRYKSRCSLFMYREDQVLELFAGLPNTSVTIEKLKRDLFVTASKLP